MIPSCYKTPRRDTCARQTFSAFCLAMGAIVGTPCAGEMQQHVVLLKDSAEVVICARQHSAAFCLAIRLLGGGHLCQAKSSSMLSCYKTPRRRSFVPGKIQQHSVLQHDSSEAVICAVQNPAAFSLVGRGNSDPFCLVLRLIAMAGKGRVLYSVGHSAIL